MSEENSVQYAIVEILGHRRHVGRVREVERFGVKMIEISIPQYGED